MMHWNRVTRTSETGVYVPAHEVVGAGPPVVLVPGTFSDRRAWHRVLGAFSPRFQCLLLDPRGTGASPDPGTPFTPDDLVEDVLAAMDAAGVDRADLVGHSLGAVVALLLAARHPGRVRRVVAAAPTLYMDAHLLAVMDHWEALARSGLGDEQLYAGLVLDAFGRAAFERLVPAVVHDMRRRPIARDTVLRYVACDRLQDLRPVAARIDAPVLIVAGEEDALPGVAQARLVAEAVPGARLEVLGACGHTPQMERPDAFARLVSGFLDR
jgi:pimeloyl-ACP methyl ester carboxylesterase